MKTYLISYFATTANGFTFGCRYVTADRLPTREDIKEVLERVVRETPGFTSAAALAVSEIGF